MVGSVLLSMHNVYYLLDLMLRAREAIIEGNYGAFESEWLSCPAAKDW
jgi:queuine tRNA-ribosyltransferase